MNKTEKRETFIKYLFLHCLNLFWEKGFLHEANIHVSELEPEEQDWVILNGNGRTGQTQDYPTLKLGVPRHREPLPVPEAAWTMRAEEGADYRLHATFARLIMPLK